MRGEERSDDRRDCMNGLVKVPSATLRPIFIFVHSHLSGGLAFLFCPFSSRRGLRMGGSGGVGEGLDLDLASRGWCRSKQSTPVAHLLILLTPPLVTSSASPSFLTPTLLVKRESRISASPILSLSSAAPPPAPFVPEASGTTWGVKSAETFLAVDWACTEALGY